MVLKVRTDIKPIPIKPPPPLSAEAVFMLFNEVRANMGLSTKVATEDELKQFKKDREEWDAKYGHRL